MSPTLMIRLTDELLDWLKETSRRTGVPAGRLIRERAVSCAPQKGGILAALRRSPLVGSGLKIERRFVEFYCE